MKYYKVGFHRNSSRIWLDNESDLNSAGFNCTKHYKVEYQSGKIVLTIDNDGNRKVSGKKGKPVIDLCSKKIIGFSDKCKVEYSTNKILIEKE